MLSYHRLYRFIPGFAGNATIVRHSWSHRSVYPRLRGERSDTARAYIASNGLSPASRGTPCRCCLDRCLARFIPGFAGNASAYSGHHQPLPVYPRLRGERCLKLMRRQVFPGLSPASRGTLLILLSARLILRFIPGFAGNAHTPD